MWRRIAEVLTFEEAEEIANRYRAQGYGEPPRATKQVQIKRIGLYKDVYAVRVREKEC